VRFGTLGGFFFSVVADINIDLDYFEHRKTKRTVGLLGRGADLLPIKLWRFCGKFHPDDGKLIGYSEQEIESACDWWGEKGRMVEVFLLVGWLEIIEGGYQVHDWLEHQGHLKAYKKRAQEAAKARWNRVRDATSMPQAMQDGVLRSATNRIETKRTVSSDGGGVGVGREFAVDPPPGMPESEDQAACVGERSGVPRERAIAYWNDIAGRGWRDGFGVAVFDFGRHAKGRFDGEVNRSEQRKVQNGSRPPSIMEMEKAARAKEALAADIRKNFCSDTASDAKWSNQEKKQEYFKLKREAKGLTRSIANSL
jgi:hypothetical protein